MNTPRSQNYYQQSSTSNRAYENQTPYLGTPTLDQQQNYHSSGKGFSFGRKEERMERQSSTPRRFYDTISE